MKILELIEGCVALGHRFKRDKVCSGGNEILEVRNNHSL